MGEQAPKKVDERAQREASAQKGVFLGFSLLVLGVLGTLASFAFVMAGPRFAPAYALAALGAVLWFVADRRLRATMPNSQFDERLGRSIPATVRLWVVDPDFSIFFVVFMLAAAALYMRMPGGVGGGFVFDEQEAILANPYVHGQQLWRNAFNHNF